MCVNCDITFKIGLPEYQNDLSKDGHNWSSVFFTYFNLLRYVQLSAYRVWLNLQKCPNSTIFLVFLYFLFSTFSEFLSFTNFAFFSHLRYENLVLVAGGIGISPFLAILSDILHSAREDKTCLPRNILIIWAIKKSNELSLLSTVDMESICPSFSDKVNIEIQIYVTRESEPPLVGLIVLSFPRCFSVYFFILRLFPRCFSVYSFIFLLSYSFCDLWYY